MNAPALLMPTHEQLLALAHGVARWARGEASRQQDLANFEVDAENLSGMCAMAAVRTYTILKNAGVQDVHLAVTSRWIECHAFVVVHGVRVDPTAAQFGVASPVVESHASGRKTPWYHARAKLFQSVDAFCRHIESMAWNDAQHPRRMVAGLDTPPKLAQWETC